MKTVEATIRPLEPGDYPGFFAYLNAQLEENGKNGKPLFQPVSRQILKFPPDKESSFVAGLSKAIGQAGWRRAWVICNNAGQIMGHIDLRAHSDPGIAHRALLGMGVALDFRRMGLGSKLLDFACDWVKDHDLLDWIDIEVLSVNKPAVALYKHAGFDLLCEIPDLFRIDDKSEAVIRMARKIS